MDAGIKVYPGGRLVVHALPLKTMITAAYDAGYWQLSGGEEWMGKDIYDVEAKPSPQSGTYSVRHTRYGIGDERVRLMLQTLLTERFQLKVHRETKTGPVFLLERSGKSLLLHSTKYTEEQPAFGASGFSGEIEHVGGHWFLFDTSMPQLAKFAADYVLHKPVIDQTGLGGSFDYRDADWKTDQDNTDFEGSFTVFIRDIGLKLTSAKGPVETFVIEHAAKPSAN